MLWYNYETQQVLEGTGSVCVATLTFLRDPLLWSTSSSSSAVKYESSSLSSWCSVHPTPECRHDSGKITPLGNPSRCCDKTELLLIKKYHQFWNPPTRTKVSPPTWSQPGKWLCWESDSCSGQLALSPRLVSGDGRLWGEPGGLGSAWTGFVTGCWRPSVRSEVTSEEELEEVPQWEFLSRVPGSDFVFAEQSWAAPAASRSQTPCVSSACPRTRGRPSSVLAESETLGEVCRSLSHQDPGSGCCSGCRSPGVSHYSNFKLKYFNNSVWPPLNLFWSDHWCIST